MNDKNNILLISDDEKLSKTLVKKLIFLRQTDNVIVSDYEHAKRNIQLALPNIIILHECLEKLKTIDLISDVVKNDDTSSIILLTDNNDADFILSAYDAGIVDFASSNAADFELVIRAVNNMKNMSVKNKLKRNNRLLIQSGIIDELTGLYSQKHAKCVIENEINYNLLDDGVFMAVEPSEESKTKFSIEKMAKALKASIRSYDVVTLAKGAKFYVLLPKTDLNGALTVMQKIKLNYGDNFEIKAGITSFARKTFEQVEREALKALSEAVYSNENFVFVEDKHETLDDWLDVDDDTSKNYKLFRQIFNKKMDKIIAPVFFRLQKAYEEKLFGTTIEQYTDGEQCVFCLKNKKQESNLRIVYPGFAKIVIYITHEGLDSPENRELSLPLTKITQKELIEIVENFIKEFKYTSIE